MKLTQEQTDKILEGLDDYRFKIIKFNVSDDDRKINTSEEISEEYFNELVNDVLMFEDLEYDESEDWS